MAYYSYKHPYVNYLCVHTRNPFENWILRLDDLETVIRKSIYSSNINQFFFKSSFFSTYFDIFKLYKKCSENCNLLQKIKTALDFITYLDILKYHDVNSRCSFVKMLLDIILDIDLNNLYNEIMILKNYNSELALFNNLIKKINTIITNTDMDITCNCRIFEYENPTIFLFIKHSLDKINCFLDVYDNNNLLYPLMNDKFLHFDYSIIHPKTRQTVLHVYMTFYYEYAYHQNHQNESILDKNCEACQILNSQCLSFIDKGAHADIVDKNGYNIHSILIQPPIKSLKCIAASYLKNIDLHENIPIVLKQFIKYHTGFKKDRIVW